MDRNIDPSAPAKSAQAPHFSPREARRLARPWERCTHHAVLPNVWACPACFVEMRELHRKLIDALESIRSGRNSAEQIHEIAGQALDNARSVYKQTP